MQIYPMQMSTASLLAKKYPDIQIILNHMGMPLDLSAEGLNIWRKGLLELASRNNVAIKISGFGMFNHQWTVHSIKELVLEVINIFGVDRCMFGSNFSVDKLYGDYDTLFNAYQKIVESFSKLEQEKLFYKNAEKFYRI